MTNFIEECKCLMPIEVNPYVSWQRTDLHEVGGSPYLRVLSVPSRVACWADKMRVITTLKLTHISQKQEEALVSLSLSLEGP